MSEIVPAFPGFDVLIVAEIGGKLHLTHEPVVAWRIRKREDRSGDANEIVPITLGWDGKGNDPIRTDLRQSDIVRRPDGSYSMSRGPEHLTLEEVLQHLQRRTCPGDFYCPCATEAEHAALPDARVPQSEEQEEGATA